MDQETTSRWRKVREVVGSVVLMAGLVAVMRYADRAELSEPQHTASPYYLTDHNSGYVPPERDPSLSFEDAAMKYRCEASLDRTASLPSTEKTSVR